MNLVEVEVQDFVSPAGPDLRRMGGVTMNVEFLTCGDTGLSVQFGNHIERSLNERVIRFKWAIDRACISGVVETVPTYRALMVHYDPLQTTQAALIREIEPLLYQTTDAPFRGTCWRIPACYDPEFAPDLQDVAKWANMTLDRVVEIHTSTVHYVYMTGFAPGQPHMGDLPEVLALGRRKDPRPRIEKGSIVTATRLTIIYPFANPSGWHIIGRSPISVFDIEKDPPALLRPGDHVIFDSVSTKEFQEISRMVNAGIYKLEKDLAMEGASRIPAPDVGASSADT